MANNGDEAKFQEVVDSLLQHKDYPKIEEYHKRQKRLEIKKKFIEGMSVEEFLEYFEDPEKVRQGNVQIYVLKGKILQTSAPNWSGWTFTCVCV